jgi:hypothetical protein
MVDVSDATEQPPLLLLDLPQELIAFIVGLLPPLTLDAFHRCTKDARLAKIIDWQWASLLRTFFPDVGSKRLTQQRRISFARSEVPSARDTFFNHFSPRDRPAFPCALCGDTLQLHSSGSTDASRLRCPCVVARTRHLRLRLGQLDESRSRQSYLSDRGFACLLSTLQAHFAFSAPVDLPKLDPSSLEKLDVLLICTTQGPALTTAELAALREWVHAGGALITSAFSNWSQFGHFAATTVGWLGIGTTPRAPFMQRTTHAVRHAAAALPLPTSESLGSLSHRSLTSDSAPFGEVTRFTNTGECVFRLLDVATDSGAVPLVPPQADDRGPRGETLVFYPPGGEITGRGRVLVCSNYHWLCDALYWQGGSFGHTGGVLGRDDDNDAFSCRLLLNFVAGAVAARVRLDEEP